LPAPPAFDVIGTCEDLILTARLTREFGGPTLQVIELRSARDCSSRTIVPESAFPDESPNAAVDTGCAHLSSFKGAHHEIEDLFARDVMRVNGAGGHSGDSQRRAVHDQSRRPA
jgi:hypothetical protein